MAQKIVVVGTGYAGLVAALACARRGVKVTLAGPRPGKSQIDGDTRSTALMPGSVRFLRNIDVWERCAGASAPLRAIRIVDDTGAVFRSPETLFTAHEAGLEAFAFNIANARLMTALLETVAQNAAIEWAETPAVTSLAIGRRRVTISDVNGLGLKCEAVVAADGRGSVCRESAGFSVRRWAYPQTAVALQFTHREPHHGVSNEFHRAAGPFTTVPGPGDTSHLVWVETPEEAQRICGLDIPALAGALEERLQGLLGTVSDPRAVAAFPLSGMIPLRCAQSRVYLVGEAGHVMPPIGAQGLNLGFRDAAALADCLAAHPGDLGGDAAMERYQRARQGDVALRTLGVDLLNRSLITSFIPMQMLRGAGLHLLNAWPGLRQAVMRRGLQPSGALPSLMQANGVSDRELGVAG